MRARAGGDRFWPAPKTTTTFIVFSVAIGFTSSPRCRDGRAGRQAPRHALPRHPSFGIVMLSHQIGGFLGAWLGAACSRRPRL